jgi:hypothetical protein
MINIRVNQLKIIGVILGLLFGMDLYPQGVIPRPPLMGWASWNQFGANISDAIIKKQADAMASSGLLAVGYQYINIDDGFFDGRNSDGSLKINTTKFPNGMKSLADYIHSRGLKAGFYSEAGSNTCGSKYSGQPGGVGGGMYNHDQQDANLFFKTWGFNFLKVDYCGAQDQHLDERTRYTAIRNAILNTGEEVNYNVCRWQFPGTWVTTVADSWRMSTDINFSPGSTPKWTSIVNIINLNKYNAPYSSPGHYNDMDMLEVGRGLPFEEDKSHFSMWCMLSSPLVLGCDMTKITSQTKSLLTNKEVIAISQDTTGPNPQAHLLSDNNGLQVWVKKLNGRQSTERAVTLFNQSASSAVMTIKWKDLNLVGPATVRDLWAGTNLGTMDSMFSATVPSHGVLLLKVVGAKAELQETFEGEYAWLNNYNLTQNTSVLANQARAVIDASCSGGAKAGYIGNGVDNFIEFRDVYANVSGKYTLVITYLSGENRSATLRINGKDTLLSNLNSGGFSNFKSITCSININKGYNIIRLTNSTGSIPDIDKIHIDLNKNINGIVKPIAIISAVGTTTFCAGSNVILNANTGNGYTYIWKKDGSTIIGATSISYTAMQSGSYTVMVTANSQVTTSSAVVVTVNALPLITQYSQVDGGAWNQTSSSTVCASSTIVLGPQPNVTTGWSWSGPSGYSATTREITLTALAVNKSGNYTATYTDGNSCKAIGVYALTVNAAPLAPIVTATQTYCQNGTATALTATGIGLLWYTSATGGTGSTTAPTPSTATTGTTNYYVSQTTTGCESARAMIAVTVTNTATASITTTSPTAFCTGGSVVLTASTGTSYKWFNGSTQVGTAATYSATTAGSYTVEVTNGGNCKATSSATNVTVNASPSAPTVTATQTYCQNGTATALTATGTGLLWYTSATGGTGSTTAPTPSTAITGATNYYVSQTTTGCESSRSMIAVTVTNTATASITTTSPTVFCTGGSVVLTANTGTSYKWFNGSTQVGTAATYSAITAGSYTVEVTNGGNCKATSSATNVTVNALPVAIITAGSSTSIPQGGSVVLTASTGSSYKWFNGTAQVGTNASYTATTPGAYSIQVTNASNCSATSAATNVNLNSNQPSVITITSPTNSSTVQGAITITVTATNPAGSITKVEYLDGNTVIGTSTSAPYSFVWNTPTVGDHLITVRVTDSNGGITTSAPITVTSEATATGLFSSNSNSLNGVVYPNPANRVVFIDSDSDLSDASFMLVDVLGNEHDISHTGTGLGAQIDVSDLSSGTYVLIIKKDGSVMRKKITVIK